VQDGRLAVEGAGGRSWQIVTVIPDAPPEISLDGPIERTVAGEMRQPFRAQDDYGVVSGRRRCAGPRRGRPPSRPRPDPEPREALAFDLPMPITGERTDFREVLVEDLAQHPWAGLPVTVTLSAEDAVGQTGETGRNVVLPGRRFFDPLASAIVEQRRDLLWNRDNAAASRQVLRAVSHRPEDVFRSETVFLKLRVALRRLETGCATASSPTRCATRRPRRCGPSRSRSRRASVRRARTAAPRAGAAVRGDAQRRHRRGDRRADAELREAMQDYMRQLAEQAPQDNQQMSEMQDMQEITPDQLEQMLQRLQELMEQGRMDEAQALLDQLRQMMENMQIAQGQQGQGQPSPGQQAMEGLAETLRQQQGLSDETFGDLQQQFGQGGQPGPDPGSAARRGAGGRGRQSRARARASGRPCRTPAGAAGRTARQQGQLPGAGTSGDDAVARRARPGGPRDGAGRGVAPAGRSRRRARQPVGRDGGPARGDARTRRADGAAAGPAGSAGRRHGAGQRVGRRDPLGRETGQNGRIGTDQQLLQGDDVYRRAEELLDEIRRRSGDQSRPRGRTRLPAPAARPLLRLRRRPAAAQERRQPVDPRGEKPVDPDAQPFAAST
jgi:hypothetical protein